MWAPLHAWRALDQLRAAEAAAPLTSLFHKLHEDDWSTEELPVVFAMIGRPAIPALAYYLGRRERGTIPRLKAAESLERVGQTDPDACTECVAVFISLILPLRTAYSTPSSSADSSSLSRRRR